MRLRCDRATSRPSLTWDLRTFYYVHDIGISRGLPAIRSSEQDQYALSTLDSPTPDDEWSSFVDPTPFFPNYGQAGGRKQFYASLD
jgi:hypothetical protein